MQVEAGGQGVVGDVLLHVTASGRERNYVRYALRILRGQGDAVAGIGKGVVRLWASGAASTKCVSVCEIVKREMGGTLHQWTSISSALGVAESIGQGGGQEGMNVNGVSLSIPPPLPSVTQNPRIPCLPRRWRQAIVGAFSHRIQSAPHILTCIGYGCHPRETSAFAGSLSDLPFVGWHPPTERAASWDPGSFLTRERPLMQDPEGAARGGRARRVVQLAITLSTSAVAGGGGEAEGYQAPSAAVSEGGNNAEAADALTTGAPQQGVGRTEGAGRMKKEKKKKKKVIGGT